MNFDLAEKIYYHEEDRKNSLLNSLTFVMAAIGLAIGLLIYYINTYLDSFVGAVFVSQSQSFLHYCFILILACAFLAISIAIIFVVKSFHNYTYRYLPSPNELMGYYSSLKNYYLGHENARKLIDHEFNKYMVSEFVEAADHNDKNNMTRKRNIHHATRWTIFSLIALGLTFIPFLLHPRYSTKSLSIDGFGSELTVTISPSSNTNYTQEEQNNVGQGTIKETEQNTSKATENQAGTSPSEIHKGERGQSEATKSVVDSLKK